MSERQPAVGAPVEPSVRPAASAPHCTVRTCVWNGMAWTVSLTVPTKLELRARLYARAEVDAMVNSERQKTLRDAARWVDEEVGHAVQDGWSVEAVQALMATRDMLKAHADMQATTVEVKA